MRKTCIRTLLGASLAILFASPCLAQSPAEAHPGAAEFAADVARRHQVPEAGILALLAAGQRQQSIIDAMRRPAEAKPWHEYRQIFMTPLRITAGRAFFEANRELLTAVGDEYGVDPEYVTAILGVETSYGVNTGKYRVLDALVTLAFYYPSRAKYFRGELEKFLTMPESQLPGARTEVRGSYAGAMGWGQFMPTSIAAYARDGDGDGRIDLGASLPDIVASVANYLARHGWQHGAAVAIPVEPAADAVTVTTRQSEPVHTVGKLAGWGYVAASAPAPETPATLLRLDGADGDRYWLTFKNFYVITRYNRSPLYAMAVTELAAAIRAGGDAPAVPGAADTVATPAAK